MMILIRNITKKKIIAKNVRVCANLFLKAKGLMFSKKPRPLVFVFKKERIIPLHMCFVFFPIDVLFLNKEKKVVETKENFLPWTFYTPVNKAMYVVELEKGIIGKTRTKVGDLIGFSEK